MTIQCVYPIIVVPKDRLAPTRDFYVRRLGLSVVFEATWFVGLAHRSDAGPTLAVMSHDRPSSPPGADTFDGRGVPITLQVTDARAMHERLRAEGVAIEYPLHDEAWGQRRFLIRDPAGTAVDVVQQIEPAPGFWDEYLPAATGT